MKRNSIKIMGAVIVMTTGLLMGCGISGQGTVQSNTSTGEASTGNASAGNASTGNASAGNASTGNVSAANGDIGQDEAKRIAFEDAGVQESDTTRLKISREQDDGRLQYDVKFSVAEKEYDYDINGADGMILSADVEITGGNAAQTQINGNAGNSARSSGANVAVSEADAKAAALARVNGATEADLRMELELDDGYYVYEGDIIYQQKEYEFEIDAQTGNFLKWSEERY